MTISETYSKEEIEEILKEHFLKTLSNKGFTVDKNLLKVYIDINRDTFDLHHVEVFRQF